MNEHAADQPRPFADLELEPWQWPEEQWRHIVGQVSAGRRLRPRQWPDGARCAVALSFDSDHETGELRDGGRSIGRISQGQFEYHVAVPKILAFLRRENIRVSFFVPAVVALLHPDEQKRVVADGHEVGIHGWIHERNSLLPADSERDLLMRSCDALEKIVGRRPVGIRTPSWDFSANTLSILREMELNYDSSLMADVDCYELLEHGEPTGLVELPVEWVRDDGVYFNMNRFEGLRPYTPPAGVFDIFKRDFDAAYQEGGLFQLTMHPLAIGQRSRMWILEELVAYIKSKDGIWFATHEQVVNYVREHSQ